MTPQKPPLLPLYQHQKVRVLHGVGQKFQKGPASLREIQDEQSKVKVNLPTRNKDQFEDLSNGRSEGKVLLSSFLPSKPIPIVSAQTTQASDADKGTPPWAASGTPPSLSRPSLSDIQMQQVKQHCLSHSPKTRTTGFSIASSQGSPSESPGMNRTGGRNTLINSINSDRGEGNEGSQALLQQCKYSYKPVLEEGQNDICCFG